MRDSYERFFSEGYISKEQFFDFGIRETIYAPLEKAKEGWEELKHRIRNNGPVYMRGFGRNSNGSHLFQEFYSQVLGNENVKIDPTNNKEPTTVIRDMTGYGGLWRLVCKAVYMVLVTDRGKNSQFCASTAANSPAIFRPDSNKSLLMFMCFIDELAIFNGNLFNIPKWQPDAGAEH